MAFKVYNTRFTAGNVEGGTGDLVLTVDAAAADTGKDMPANALVKHMIVTSPADTVFSLGTLADVWKRIQFHVPFYMGTAIQLRNLSRDLNSQ